jgi:hypothetical protein
MDSQRTDERARNRSVYPLLFGLCPVLVLLFTVRGYAKYDGGSGTPTDPYRIATPEQLYDISDHKEDWDKCFKLTADINLSTYTARPFKPIGLDYGTPFAGTFDGGGHKISNFTYRSEGPSTGLFGHVGYVATVKNLGLINVTVSGLENVGGLAGGVQGPLGTIANCYVTGRVSGKNFVGGLTGRPNGRIYNCYSMAEVSGDTCVGGLAGLNDGAMIYNCYATGTVMANQQMGGLVGRQGSGGKVVGSFWDAETVVQTVSAGGNARTTAAMKKATTFVGWGGCDSEGIWTINEGKDYPRLAWEGKPGRVITGQLSDMVPGRGMAADPYLISTAEQLNAIGLFPCERNRHFRLTADIDLSAYKGAEFNRIGNNDMWPFAGSFDGDRHIISNFTYEPPNQGDYQFVGLFGDIAGSAVVKNLGLVDVRVGGYDHVGGLAGRNNGGTISNCYVTGQVLWSGRAGLLVGVNAGSVTTSWATGSVAGGDLLGGLTGENMGILSNCYAIASVSADYDFTGSGGLVGNNGGQISNCYAAGAVSGPLKAVGGLVGENSPEAVVNHSFWDTQTTHQTASAGGTGKTTHLMMTESTFTDAGWDFVGETANGTNDLWMMPAETGYPVLVWESENESVPEPLLPIAYWTFDEIDGTVAHDSTGANDGHVQGARWSDGPVGGALAFDGLDDYVDCGSDPALAPEQMTIAFWIWVDSRVSYQYPLGRISDTTAAREYMFSTGGEGKLEFSFGLDAWKRVVVVSQSTLPVRQWVHVAATRDGAMASLYLDGQLQDWASYSFVPPHEAQALRIGSVGTTEGAGFFKGKLDDVRIYDRALTEEETQELYQEAGQEP